MHRAELGIEIAPATVTIKRHRQSPLRTFYANHPSIAGPGALDSVCLHHRIVLVVDPTLAANVRTREQAFQIFAEFRFFAELNVFRHFAWHRRLPTLQRPLIHRSIICEGGIRDLGNNLAVLQHPHAVFADNAPDLDRVESPFAENFVNFFLAAFLRDQQHALLRFAQQDFISAHPSFALRDAIHFDFNANIAARAHLASGAGESGGAHVLNANHRTGLHGFEARLKQKLL